jgi:ribonuclease VapC
VAVIKGEPEEQLLLQLLWDCPSVVGWPTVFETRIWLLRQSGGQAAAGWLEDWLARAHVEKVPFGGELERLAALAFRRFGKGLHPAALNYGDCMSYAVAAARGVPLLFKGSDFGKTDVAIHPASVMLA